MIVQPEAPAPVGYHASPAASSPKRSPKQVPPPSKINVVRILIAILLVGGVAFYFLGNKEPQKINVAVNSSMSSGALNKLSPQQQQYVRDTYRLADSLFKQGRYELARQEISKIHQLVPFYEESKTLENLANVAIQTQVDQQKAEAQEKSRQEMEEKIQRQVTFCRTKINDGITQSGIDECLSSVMQFNPDHPAIVGLKSEVDELISSRALRDSQNHEYQERVRRHKSLYSKAEKMQKVGNPLQALKAYEEVVRSSLPDPNNLKGQAKRQIASIQQSLVEKQAEYEKIADASYKKGDLKSAILTLKKAEAINPNNESIRGQINSMVSELKRQMQTFYQEGILEESVGEVETAKTKWKKIIELSLPEEDYYKKAKMKLKKYGSF